MKEPKSLSFFVALWTGVGVAASMAAYATFQFFAYPRMTIGSLFVEHLWHVLVLAAVIYGICWAVFRRVLIRPIRSIHMHLYAVGTGRVRPLELESNVTEIRMIVEGVTLMLQRMGHGAWRDTGGTIDRHIERMRGMIHDARPDVAGDTLLPLLDELAGLEGAVRSLLASADRETAT